MTRDVASSLGSNRLSNDIASGGRCPPAETPPTADVLDNFAADGFYVGGRRTTKGVRITIDHIALRNPDQASRRRTAAWITAMLQSHLIHIPGLHWEFHVDETSDDLWMINGLVPPPGGSDAEEA